MSVINFTPDELSSIKGSIIKIQFNDDDEKQKRSMESVFKIANKNSVHWASLFVYCYENLLNLNNPKMNAQLAPLRETYLMINSDLEEYNRDVQYGKHYIYNSLRRAVEPNILAIREIIDFTFTQILYEQSIDENNILEGIRK